VEGGASTTAADRWYRWQVLHSVAPIAARQMELVLTGRLRRGGAARRS
jgi:hypothetical protein